ncbi:MAG: formylglycine-generating enzyme family protein [Planctomycetota bacterium]|nr:formylglycine-generating enzyme family protein [Planctomycetota bacterium]
MIKLVPAAESTLPTLTLDLGGGVTLELVLIPAGKFTMGSPATETEAHQRNDETQHEVTISTPFYMGQYEITQAQYEAVIGSNPSRVKGAKNPVEQVSWDGAQEFCRKLSAKAGKTLRLPTEAEWEYACRAGTTTRFSSGDADSALADVAWYDANSERKPHPVGQKKPNAWGLYDMHGNVWEWCQDFYGAYAEGTATDPPGAVNGTSRVVRGSGWVFSPWSCRSANRGGSPPDPRYGGADIGFRVVVPAGSH